MPSPRRPNTAVRLDETTLAFLDRRAARLGVKRSDVIREAITCYLAAEDWDWPGRGEPLSEPGPEKVSGSDCPQCEVSAGRCVNHVDGW
jgi:hypothetical protein